MGSWKVILPETATNYVLNPVGMGVLASTVHNVATGAATQVSTYSYLGYQCFRLTGAADNDGAYWDLSTLSNTDHYITIRVHSASDISPMFDISLNNVQFTTPLLVSTEGNWWVYGYWLPAVQAVGSVTLYILQNGAGAMNVFIGHIQVEAALYRTTPITGDIKGFCSDGYYWNGTPHASSSTRAAKERSGGREYDLETDYNFRVLYGLGSGMPPITHHVQGMALLPGALYQGHKVEPRILDLVSGTKVNTTATVAAARKNFINAIKPDRVSPDQPVVFRYSGVNASKPVQFYGVYDSGMEFQLNNGVVDKPVARFIAYDPFAYETHSESAVLTTSASVANADYILRKINGTWYNISTDFGSSINTIVRGLDGCIYIGGGFTDVGNANGDYIVKWNPFTGALSSLGTGMNGIVYTLAVAPNGDIYAGGDFTSAGGVAETDRFAYWDISASAWVSVTATHPSATVRSLAFDQSGNLFVGGDFVDLGDASGDYIAKYIFGTGWASLGSGFDNLVDEIAVAPNGDIYAVGSFTVSGAITLNGIGKWNGVTWSALGTGVSGGTATVTAIAIDKAGNIYIGGDFTSADGVSCTYIAKWNGKTFEPLGSGMNGQVMVLTLSSKGNLYAGGNFTTAGGITLSDRIAIWNGTTWMHVDCNTPGAPSVLSILLDPLNNIYFGYSSAGTATSSYLNTVTNNGSATAYPVIKIKRADDGTTAVLEWIKNETTGDTLWCNYSLLKGETLTIDLTPGNRSIKSDFFGDVWRAVLRSSDLSSFNLLPGANSISVFVNPTGAPTITAWMEWPITHWSSDAVAA